MKNMDSPHQIGSEVGLFQEFALNYNLDRMQLPDQKEVLVY